jgi:hypothetical protein
VLSQLTALIRFTGGKGAWADRNEKLRLDMGVEMEARSAECLSALPSVARMLEAHRKEPLVCEAACTVVRNITGANGTLCDKAKDIINPLLSVLTLHSGSPSVCRVACGALQNLATQANRPFFGAAVTPVLVQVMKQHPVARDFAAGTLQKLGEREAADTAVEK